MLTDDDKYFRTVIRYLDQGLDLKAAREMAAADADFQKDKDDEREGDWTR